MKVHNEIGRRKKDKNITPAKSRHFSFEVNLRAILNYNLSIDCIVYMK